MNKGINELLELNLHYPQIVTKKRKSEIKTYAIYERLFLPFDFDLRPILALHIAYGFFPPPLRFTFVTQRSNFLVLSPFFLPCGIKINGQYI